MKMSQTNPAALFPHSPPISLTFQNPMIEVKKNLIVSSMEKNKAVRLLQLPCEPKHPICDCVAFSPPTVTVISERIKEERELISHKFHVNFKIKKMISEMLSMSRK